MKILVTGGTGMVGRHLRDIMPNAIYVGSGHYDLRDYSQAFSMLKYNSPDAVIHLAARVGGLMDNIQNKWAYFEDNMRMNMNVLMAAKNLGIKRFIAVLSTCMYGDFETNCYPLTEDMVHNAPVPASNPGYAMTKRALALGIDLCIDEGLQYNYLMPCNLYGEYGNFDKKAHYVNALIAKIYDANKMVQKNIILMGTGKPLRQFMYAGDLAEIIKICLDKNICVNMNIATDENKTTAEIAHIALQACGSEDIFVKFNADMPDGQYRKDVSNEKFKALINFKFTTLYDGIKNTYQKYSIRQQAQFA